MKVLIISTSLEGGAGGLSYKLHESLLATGVSSNCLVKRKSKDIDDDRVIIGKKTGLIKILGPLRQFLDYFPLMLYPKRDFFDLFSLQWLPDSIPTTETVKKIQPDIINLHWICGSFIKIETLKKVKIPIVWTLHDMWAFTGGCHQSVSCSRYAEKCGGCPQLNNGKNWDLSRWVWRRKAKSWKDLNITVAAPSRWLAERARSSSLFKNNRIELIPHGIDTQRFKPIDRDEARERLNLDEDKQIILFGAWMNNRNKGFSLFQKAIQKIIDPGLQNNVEVVIFGFSRPDPPSTSSVKSQYLGRIGHDMLPMVYSAANVYVAPSIVESFGLTIYESLSCGTPVVAFNATGPKEIIEHGINGYLAKPYEVQDLARGIEWVLENISKNHGFTRRLHEKIEKDFSLSLMADRYQSLFKEVING